VSFTPNDNGCSHLHLSLKDRFLMYSFLYQDGRFPRPGAKQKTNQDTTLFRITLIGLLLWHNAELQCKVHSGCDPTMEMLVLREQPVFQLSKNVFEIPVPPKPKPPRSRCTHLPAAPAPFPAPHPTTEPTPEPTQAPTQAPMPAPKPAPKPALPRRRERRRRWRPKWLL